MENFKLPGETTTGLNTTAFRMTSLEHYFKP